MKLFDIHQTKNIFNNIHFVGIGGIGMSGIAKIFHNLGYTVQGSDVAINAITTRLTAYGIKISISHNAKNIKNASCIVVSAAIQDNNPEIIEAKKLMIPILRRAEILTELMKLKCSVAISGSHGKTTTTSLVASLFDKAGLDPTVINGGIIKSKATNAYLGKGDYLILEADESDSTFIHIPSTIAVITNINREHMDYYNNLTALKEAFKCFICNLPLYGFAVACLDNIIVQEIISTITETKIITYAIDNVDAQIVGYNIISNNYQSMFDVRIKKPNVKQARIIQHITLPIPGKHNILNALAAIAIGVELDMDFEVIKHGFNNFQGVNRRFNIIGQYNGANIIDDYAHHPVEIQATIATARDIVSQNTGRVISVFQPHRYTRLQDLFSDFTKCFLQSDKVYILDVFSAGDKQIKGINSKRLVDAINENYGYAEYLTSHKHIAPAIIASEVKSGDIILMMGAGNISLWANQLPKNLADINTHNLNTTV